MGLMDRYNKGGVTFDVDITDFTFVDLKKLSEKSAAGEIFVINGLYVNTKGNFDDHPVAILSKEKLLVDLPAHLTEDVREMLKDSEVVEAIKGNKVGFTIRTYYLSRFKKDCFGIHWEDVN